MKNKDRIARAIALENSSQLADVVTKTESIELVGDASSNLFKADSVIVGKWCKFTSPEATIDVLADSDESASKGYVYCTTGIISLKPNTTYTVNRQPNWAYSSIHIWNSNGSYRGYITYTTNADGTKSFKTPNDDTSYKTRIQFTKTIYQSGLFVLLEGTSIPANFGVTQYKINNFILEDGFVEKNHLDSELQEMLHVGDIVLDLPSSIPVICGQVAEFYNYGIGKTNIKPDEYEISLWDSIAKNYYGRFQIDATAETLRRSISSQISVKNLFNDTILSSVVPIEVYPMPSNPASAKNILFIGDSLIAGNIFSREFVKKIQEEYGLTNFKLVGRCGDGGDAGYYNINRYEAQGGFGWNNYLNDPATLTAPYNYNRFWDSSISDINIQKYMTDNCSGANLDYMVINLGMNHKVNQSAGYSGDMTIISNLAKTFLNKLHTAYPNCKVLLNGIHASSVSYIDKTFKQFCHDLNDTYKAIASDATYSSYVKFVHLSSQFDERYGMRTDTRNKGVWTTDTETYVTDYVHPNDAYGYPMLAMADVRAFIALVS